MNGNQQLHAKQEINLETGKNGQQLSKRFVVNGLKHAKPQVWSVLGYQLRVKYLGKHAILVLVVVPLVISVSTLHEVLHCDTNANKISSNEGYRARYWVHFIHRKGQTQRNT